MYEEGETLMAESWATQAEVIDEESMVQRFH